MNPSFYNRAFACMLRLSDEPWERIWEYFPEENILAGRARRKPVPTRQVLETVLWILNTSAQWHMLLECEDHLVPLCVGGHPSDPHNL